MRTFILLLGASWFCASCSSSRTLDAEQVIAPGNHISRSVLGSDVLIKKGSALNVSFSSSTRFFVSSGGMLTGFQKGARNIRIYAEEGAHLPPEKFLSRVEVVTVQNAEKAYQNRFKELPPLQHRSVDSEEEDDDDSDDDDDDRYTPDRGARAVSVFPESYKRKE